MATVDGLSEERIDEIDDLMTAFDIADEFDIEIDDNLQTLDEVKNFLRTRTQTHNELACKADFSAVNLVAKCRQEDDERRMRLQTLYDTVEQEFDNFDDHMSVVLQKEDIIGNFTEKVVRIRQSLRSGDCPILVAGETSAGKSSLLNLILGEDILPYSHLSSTSTICILRYGEQRKLRINYMYGRKGDEILLQESGEDLLKKLSKYVHQTRDREKGSSYESIELFMPIPLLQHGIFIVDSPGIGENDAMDSIVTGYLNEAFAFIYVINSANAGGVQEDRLQRFLRLVLDRKSPDEQMKFNSRAAIFVCNKWDCVPKKESELVKADTMKKLQRCWPGVSLSQVFFLSTKNAASAMRNGSTTGDFAQLLRGIEHLLPLSLTSKVQVHYTWLDYFVTRVLHHVNTYLNKTQRDTMTLEKSYKLTEQRLLKLEKEAESVIVNMKTCLEKHVQQAITELQEMLKSDAIRAKLSDWSNIDPPKGLSWAVVEAEIESLITEKLYKILCDWEDSTNHFREMQPLLLEKFKADFHIIEGKMAAIETAIERPDFQIDDDEMATKDVGHDEIHKYRHSLIQISAKKKADFGNTSSIWSPFTFIGAVFTLPMWIGRGNIKGAFDKRAEKAQMSNYQKDTSGYLTHRALYVLDTFAERDNVRKYVVSQLKPVYNVISKLETTVPKMIDADKELMATLKRDTRSVEEIKRLYEPIRQVFDKQYGLLSKYGYEDIREFHVDPSEVKGYSSPPVSQCGYFNYHHIDIATNGPDTQPLPAIMKRYLPELDEQCAYLMRKEEENFRKLRFPNIPQLYGLIQDPGSTTRKPAFLLQNCRYSLRKLQRGEVNKRPASFYKPIAVQSVVSYVRDMTCGLDFLHRKGLVHIELSLDTVMVNADSTVMLTNISLPRKIQPPTDTCKDTTWLQYLSPEVLQGEVYDTAADIYSVGLAMWELWYGEKINFGFKDAEMVSMETFSKHVTSPELASDKPMLKIWSTIMLQCWAKCGMERPTASQIFNNVKKIKWEEEDD